MGSCFCRESQVSESKEMTKLGHLVKNSEDFGDNRHNPGVLIGKFGELRRKKDLQKVNIFIGMKDGYG